MQENSVIEFHSRLKNYYIFFETVFIYLFIYLHGEFKPSAWL